MPKTLATEHIEQYKRDGVLFPIPVLTDHEVALFRCATEELESRLGSKPKLVQCAQTHLFFRWAYDLATHPVILDVVEDILGANILVHSTTIFFKPPHDPRYISWHQDGYYWHLSEPRLTSAWIALSDSSVENGCMRVVVESHTQRLAHTTSYQQESLLTLEMTVSDDAPVKDVVLKAGQMSLHHVNAVHGSNPNRSNSKRIGFAIRFIAPQIKQLAEHHAVVLARGRDDYRHFELLQGPPTGSFEQSLTAHAQFVRWLERVRISQGRPIK